VQIGKLFDPQDWNSKNKKSKKTEKPLTQEHGKTKKQKIEKSISPKNQECKTQNPRTQSNQKIQKNNFATPTRIGY
jgi:hypothetical protein